MVWSSLWWLSFCVWVGDEDDEEVFDDEDIVGDDELSDTVLAAVVVVVDDVVVSGLRESFWMVVAEDFLCVDLGVDGLVTTEAEFTSEHIVVVITWSPWLPVSVVDDDDWDAGIDDGVASELSVDVDDNNSELVDEHEPNEVVDVANDDDDVSWMYFEALRFFSNVFCNTSNFNCKSLINILDSFNLNRKKNNYYH